MRKVSKYSKIMEVRVKDFSDSETLCTLVCIVTCAQQLGNFRLRDQDCTPGVFDEYPAHGLSLLLIRYVHQTTYKCQ